MLNGPNLNLLGTREPDVYGTASLEDIERAVLVRAGDKIEITWYQTNHEGELVEFVHALAKTADGALVNAGAYTHTSLALRDALLAVRVPFVEVHLSNIFGREEARRRSMIGDLAVGVVAGFGAHSYVLGLEALLMHLSGSGS